MVSEVSLLMCGGFVGFVSHNFFRFLGFHYKLTQFCFQSGKRSVLPIKTSLFFPVVTAE